MTTNIHQKIIQENICKSDFPSFLIDLELYENLWIFCEYKLYLWEAFISTLDDFAAYIHTYILE